MIEPGRFIDALVCRHGTRVPRMHGEDVVDPAVGAIHDSGIKFAEGAIPRVVGKDRVA